MRDELVVRHRANVGDAAGMLPEWEVPNMLVKYATLMRAYSLSHR